MIRVLVVDDQKLMCEGLRVILGADNNIDVVDIALDGEAALEQYLKHRPDIVLMDIRMPGVNGVLAVKNIRQVDKTAKILMLTTFNDDEYIVEAIGNGALGYILKDIEPQVLIKAIKDAYEGNPVFTASVVQTLARKALGGRENTRSLQSGSRTREILTEREIEVAKMISKAFNNRQIASALHITEGTAKNHVSAIYSKLEINDRVRLAVFLKEQGV